MIKSDAFFSNGTVNVDHVKLVCNNVPQIVKQFDETTKIEYIKKIIGFLDLTTLSADDTPETIDTLIYKALCCSTPICAAVCVYPARLRDVKNSLTKYPQSSNLKIASVAAGFPSGQYRIESKLLEIKLALEDGANEIDIVINRSDALTGKWDVVKNEIQEMKQMCGEKVLMKTILATGELKSLENIYKASQIAMEAGSDFIKTSTGKESVNATLEVSVVMCEAIKSFYEATGKKIGFKAAGGIKTTNQALEYTVLVESILGKDWLSPDLFRIGASSLLDDLIASLGKKMH